MLVAARPPPRVARTATRVRKLERPAARAAQRRQMPGAAERAAPGRAPASARRSPCRSARSSVDLGSARTARTSIACTRTSRRGASTTLARAHALVQRHAALLERADRAAPAASIVPTNCAAAARTRSSVSVLGQRGAARSRRPRGRACRSRCRAGSSPRSVCRRASGSEGLQTLADRRARADRSPSGRACRRARRGACRTPCARRATTCMRAAAGRLVAEHDAGCRAPRRIAAAITNPGSRPSARPASASTNSRASRRSQVSVAPAAAR